MLQRFFDWEKQAIYSPDGIDSDFLTPDEFSQFLENRHRFREVETTVHEEDWERKIVHFGEGKPAIAILRIENRSKSFVSLIHPDYMGALLGLGIERKVIGDIIALEDSAYCYVKESIAPFIIESLTKAGRAVVSCTEVDTLPEEIQKKSEIREYILSSLRLDQFIATVFRASRTQAKQAVEEGLVFINGRQIQKSPTRIQEGDRITWRRKGKVRFLSVLRKTKKDLTVVQVEHLR